MRRLPLFVLLGIFALFTLTLWRVETEIHHGFLEDDGYISLRHAKNLVEGHGLTYNPGERVEAYTNFSLTILMALPYALGIDAVAFVKVTGWLSGLVVLAATGILTRRLAGAAAALVVMLALALDERFAWFATCGLETVLVGAFYVPAFLLLQRRHVVGAALLFVGAVLTRMETILLVVMAAGFLLSRCRRRSDLRLPLRFLGVFGIVYGAYYLWRYRYYGWAFPNTYYAKVGSVATSWERGVDYLVACATSMHLGPAVVASSLALLVGATALLVRRRWRVRVPFGLLVFGAFGVYAAFVVAVGGDHFRERFVYHFYPLLLVSLAWSWRVLRDGFRLRARRGAPLAFAAVLLGSLLPVSATKVGFEPAWGMASWQSVGQWLRVNARPTDLLATDAAGVIALESNLRTIDVLGLADLHIAHLDVPLGRGTAGHEKSDPAYVLDRYPAFVTTWVDDDGHVGRGFRRFFRFWRDYEIVGLVRKDLLMDVSPDRIMRVREEPTRDGLILLRGGRGPVPGQWSWAVWAKRSRPLPPRPFGRHDLASAIPGSLDHPGLLMVAPRGHAPTHVLYGPAMVFPAGRYRATYAVRFRDVAADLPAGAICKFDVWDGVRATNEFTFGDAWREREGTFETTIEVGEDAAARSHDLRFYCFGVADVTVLRGDLTLL